MSLRKLYISGYRSVQDLYITPQNINVLLGPNGSGKTNIYKAIQLLSKAASGEFSRALALEGGMPSVLWAGSRGKGAVRMEFEAQIDIYKYQLSCGLPRPGEGLFCFDPEIKEESVELVDGSKSIGVLDRNGLAATAHDSSGRKVLIPNLMSNESVLSTIKDAREFPEVFQLSKHLSEWRFYHQFRTDPDSPVRQPQIGFRTARLSNDGSDLAAAIGTILHVGDEVAFNDLLQLAFPKSHLNIGMNDGMFHLSMTFPGVQRALSAKELSDGTLQYLCLLAALLTPRPPGLIAINEPEGSLHPDLLKPLAKLIAYSAQSSQLWITTHSTDLATEIELMSGIPPIELQKTDGATSIIGGTRC